MNRFQVKTRSRSQMVNITGEVEAEILSAGMKDGWVTVFVPHTTCGVTMPDSSCLNGKNQGYTA